MYILCLFLQSLILLWRLTGILFVNSRNLILLGRLTGIFFVYSCNLWFYYEGWHVYSLFIPAFSDFTTRLTCIFYLFLQSLILLLGWHVYSLFIPAVSDFTMRLTCIFLFMPAVSDFTMKVDRYIFCLFLQYLILLRGWHVYSLFIPTISDFTMKADRYTLC